MAPIHVTLMAALQIVHLIFILLIIFVTMRIITLCNLTVIEEWPCGQKPKRIWTFVKPSALCNGVFHNTSFYGFVAGTGDYQIEFNYICLRPAYNMVCMMLVIHFAGPICDGNANTGTVTVDASQLVPCQAYVFGLMDNMVQFVVTMYTLLVNSMNVSFPPIEDIILESDCNPLCPSISLSSNYYGNCRSRARKYYRCWFSLKNHRSKMEI